MNSQFESWKKIVTNSNATVGDAINILNETGLKIVLIVSENGFLEGTVSDGDIRRGLLKGINIQDSLDKIIHLDNLVVPPEMKRELVLKLMIANKIQQIPIVDGKNKVLGVHHWSEINTVPSRQNTMVIMAGGLGTRLRPATNKIPKPMLKVSGKPILEHIIEKAKFDGFTKFVLAVYYLGNTIENHFKDGSQFDVEIDYLRETKPLGTAGALSLLTKNLHQDLVVTNGDVITEINYGQLLDFHTSHNATATMAVRLHEIQNQFGVVQTDGVKITGYEEKPILRSNINAGVYAIKPEALKLLAANENCDMPTLFERLKAHSMLTVAYPLHEHWLDIGNTSDFRKAKSNEDLTRKNYESD
jgi:dTDP-glucose pyrophosphorylase